MEEVKKKWAEGVFIQHSLHPDPDPWVIHLNRLLKELSFHANADVCSYVLFACKAD